MYLIGLFFVAFMIISIIGSDWPVKLYHYYRLRPLAESLHGVIRTRKMMLSATYAELETMVNGKQILIRFMEGSSGALRGYRGPEIRMRGPFPVILELYRRPHSRQEWGDFKEFHCGDLKTEAEWFILTPQALTARDFWQSNGLQDFLCSYGSMIREILFSHEELIIRLRHLPSTVEIRPLLEKISNM